MKFCMQEKMTSKRKTGGDGDTNASNKRVHCQNAAQSLSQKSTTEAETEAQVYICWFPNN